jgi:hypothetical protein
MDRIATLLPVVSPRVKTIGGVAWRILLGFVVAVLIAGAVLVILAYYADLKFDVEAVALAILGAGVLVFLWTRWR